MFHEGDVFDIHQDDDSLSGVSPQPLDHRQHSLGLTENSLMLSGDDVDFNAPELERGCGTSRSSQQSHMHQQGQGNGTFGFLRSALGWTRALVDRCVNTHATGGTTHSKSPTPAPRQSSLSVISQHAEQRRQHSEVRRRVFQDDDDDVEVGVASSSRKRTRCHDDVPPTSTLHTTATLLSEPSDSALVLSPSSSSPCRVQSEARRAQGAEEEETEEVSESTTTTTTSSSDSEGFELFVAFLPAADQLRLRLVNKGFAVMMDRSAFRLALAVLTDPNPTPPMAVPRCLLRRGSAVIRGDVSGIWSSWLNVSESGEESEAAAVISHFNITPGVSRKVVMQVLARPGTRIESIRCRAPRTPTERLKELQTIDAPTATALSDTSLKMMVPHLKHLTSLDVGYTYGRVTDSFISFIAQNIPSLRFLSVRFSGKLITDKSVKVVAGRLLDLEHLDVAHTNGVITDSSVSTAIAKLKKLNHLNVSGTMGQVTDRSLMRFYSPLQYSVATTPVGEGASNLTTLDVSFAGGGVTDEAMCRIIPLLPKLKNLNMAHANGKIGDPTLVALAQHFPEGLEVLDISDNEGKVTNVGVAAVAKSLTKRYQREQQHLKGEPSTKMLLNLLGTPSTTSSSTSAPSPSPLITPATLAMLPPSCVALSE